ncbi:MAG: hypothetical protein JWL58_502 [Streptosporangiaceae bacterium]|jgi:hypothetical protein|nr:hypothetical protein [Streptosporangiaceae bacterium]
MDALARRMWTLYEPVHSLTYFAPEARTTFEEAGLRGFWRAYFAGRAAPLGPTGPAPVVASFFGFAPAMVARALPGVWDLIPPWQALRARTTGAQAAMERLLPGHEIGPVAELLEQAIADLDVAGRVLGAANAALPAGGGPAARVWRAATVLREHRGDGHVAALVAAGLDGCESLVLRSTLDIAREDLQPNRGWTDSEWDQARHRLTERGWIDVDGRATAKGISEYRALEDATDRAAARPWQALGTEGVDRLITLLTPISKACGALLPARNPIGLHLDHPQPPIRREARSGRDPAEEATDVADDGVEVTLQGEVS